MGIACAAPTEGTFYVWARIAYAQWIRFSFGPPLANVQMGLDRLHTMLRV